MQMSRNSAPRRSSAGFRSLLCPVISVPEVSTLSLGELLALRAAISTEMKARACTRTSTSAEGELMERIVADAYEGVLAPPTSKSVDVVLPDDRAVQVKVRSLPRGDSRFWQFEDFEFDLAVVVSMERDTAEILFARELTRAELEANAVIHTRGGYRLRMRKGRSLGIDATDRLKEAYAALR
jgi:hypothetical protein